MSRFGKLGGVVAGLAAVASVGCGAPATEEDLAEMAAIDQVSQPIWEDTCNSFLDDTEFGSFDESYSAGYGHGSGCNKTFIKEVTNFDKTHLEYVAVIDRPTSESECETSWGAAQLFRKSGSNWLKLTSDGNSNYQKYGEWVDVNPPLLPFCFHELRFPASLFTTGATYRIHATMRTSRNGNTKGFSFFSKIEPF